MQLTSGAFSLARPTETETTRQIARLDPDRDYQEIARLLSAYEFSWDTERALEFALFRTFAVPSISGLLAKTGEFTKRPRKRYDDTELILAEIVENGFDSKKGAAAMARMNAMHGRFAISNDDFLYVLSTFVFEPIRWNARFGWRRLSDNEKRASFNFYSEMGRRMNIRDIPATLEQFEAFNRSYESKAFRFAESNVQVGSATRDLLLGFLLPRFLYPTARPFVHALMDKPLLTAMGFAPAPGLLRSIVTGGLKARAFLIRTLVRRKLLWYPARRNPVLITQRQRPTYPQGYQVQELGTFKQSINPVKKDS